MDKKDIEMLKGLKRDMEVLEYAGALYIQVLNDMVHHKKGEDVIELLANHVEDCADKFYTALLVFMGILDDYDKGFSKRLEGRDELDAYVLEKHGINLADLERTEANEREISMRLIGEEVLYSQLVDLGSAAKFSMALLAYEQDTINRRKQMS